MKNKSVFIFILERKYLRRQSEYKEVGTKQSVYAFFVDNRWFAGFYLHSLYGEIIALLI
jgi:hypothetical protein